ncbi:hypothetical protein TNCV_42131 [Trichonephila clavipes]|nr:hypothetical protein TNCV_42131 [Trichonephila clavipes]
MLPRIRTFLDKRPRLAMSTQLRCVKSPRPRQMVLSYRLSTSMSANQVREIVNNLLLKLLVSLFKIHASEKELGKNIAQGEKSGHWTGARSDF